MRYFEHIDATVIPDDHPVSVFYSSWLEVEQEQQHVSWHHMNPKHIAEALPWLLLLEANGTGRYKYVICGTGCEDLFGFSYQGKFFGESLPVDAVEQRQKEFDIIESGGGPLFSVTTIPIPEKDNKEIYRGVFGFASDVGKIDKIGVVLAPR